jgi:NAD(P)-dependent dehydrogenase (short-subunit alcohol dehydrogenase family)
MAEPLSGKVAIVTGAGGGIGRPTAQLLARSGAAVAAVDINEDAARETARLITAGGGRALALRVDITREADIRAMVAATLAEFGGVDVLVNNAALGSPNDHDIIGMTAETWDHVVGGNSRGTMLCCKYALPAMIERGGGAIVNIASGAALTGQLTQAAYNASKAAVISLTQSVATMYGKQGIRCNAIAPGLILHERLAAGFPAAYVQMDKDNVLTPYQGQPDDVAAAVLFLASDAARFITGHVLPVDGGLLAHTPFYAQTRALNESTHYRVQGVLGTE